GRSDVEGKLASLLKDKSRPSRFAGAREPNDATAGAGLAAEMGMEEEGADAAEPAPALPVDEPSGPLGALPQVAPTPAATHDEGLGNVLVALIEDVLVKTAQPRPSPPAGAA